MNTKLLLLIVSLPPNPSSLRVRVWRRLRAVGAVALKRTVHLLPDTPDHYELFQWLAQEIQRTGGEATLLRVEQIENMSSGEVIQLFHEARRRAIRGSLRSWPSSRGNTRSFASSTFSKRRRAPKSSD